MSDNTVPPIGGQPGESDSNRVPSQPGQPAGTQAGGSDEPTRPGPGRGGEPTGPLPHGPQNTGPQGWPQYAPGGPQTDPGRSDTQSPGPYGGQRDRYSGQAFNGGSGQSAYGAQPPGGFGPTGPQGQPSGAGYGPTGPQGERRALGHGSQGGYPSQPGQPGPSGLPGSQAGYAGQYGAGSAPYHGGSGLPPIAAETMQWGPEPRKRRGKLVPILAALAVLFVVAGGGAFAYSRIAGGGDQPDAVLPGTAIAYARVDLDPGAGQKIAALRFLMKFPSVKEKVGLTSENDDPKRKLFDLIKKESGGDLADVDYDRDIKPWLGDRLGVAALPSGRQEPDAVVAVQVKDEDEAKAGFDKLFAKENDKPGVAFKGDYAVLAEDQAKADQAVATANDSPLADNAEFARDKDALGEQGFASFWMNAKAMQDLVGKERALAMQGFQGTMAGVLRFDANHVELKGVVHGDELGSPTENSAGDIAASMPDSTAAVFALGDGAATVDRMWTSLQQSAKSGGIFDLDEMTRGLSEKYGLTLPEDLKTLLGKRAALVMAKGGTSKVALKADTDPAKAEAVVDKAIAAVRGESGGEVPLFKATSGESIVVSTSQEYADEVLKGGQLGKTEGFEKAIPDASGAASLIYADVASLSSISMKASNNRDVQALQSFGVVSRVTGEGEAEFTVRLVAR